MAITLSVGVRNARLDQLETTIGTAPILRIYSGSEPTNITDAPTGTLLAEMTLPSDWLAAASSGQKAKAGTWQDASANATGTAGYFRIRDSGDTTSHMQGTVTATGGGGDLELNNTSINSGQQVTITSFTLTSGNGD
jgi:hypothetical protein